MIILTKISWVQTKKLSDEEREILEAKKAVIEDYDSYDDAYEDTEKNAIIDTEGEKVYIEIDEKTVCMTRLLSGEYYTNDRGNLERIEERLYFQGNLTEIYNELKSKQQ